MDIVAPSVRTVPATTTSGVATINIDRIIDLTLDTTFAARSFVDLVNADNNGLEIHPMS
jgi:hypothetical protein